MRIFYALCFSLPPAQGQGKTSYLHEKGNPAVWLAVSTVLLAVATVLLVVATVLLVGGSFVA